MGKKQARGPKGGVRHQPGRGHDRKSAPSKRRRFAERQERRRREEEEDLRRRWDQWDSLSDEVERLRPELEPERPRPSDAPESEGAGP